jgi:hypothetical protein
MYSFSGVEIRFRQYGSDASSYFISYVYCWLGTELLIRFSMDQKRIGHLYHRRRDEVF